MFSRLKEGDWNGERKKILWLDDSKDIGKKPLPIDNPEAKKVYERLMKKYKVSK